MVPTLLRQLDSLPSYFSPYKFSPISFECLILLMNFIPSLKLSQASRLPLLSYFGDKSRFDDTELIGLLKVSQLLFRRLKILTMTCLTQIPTLKFCHSSSPASYKVLLLLLSPFQVFRSLSNALSPVSVPIDWVVYFRG